MKINKTTKNFIKPQTPTPHNLKNYKLSFIDSYMVPMNFAVILFYNQSNSNPQTLQQSLATTLIDFYPLAGRYLKKDRIIDCNDNGVEFIEAEVLDTELTALMASTDLDMLDLLLPAHYFRPIEASDPLMSIQATHFRRGGGMTVAVSVYHKVFDAASLATFVVAWAANAAGKSDGELISPSFHLPSLLPFREQDFGVSASDVRKIEKIDAVERFVFDRTRIRRLESEIGRRISKARAVCAFIAKVLTRTDQAVWGKWRDLVILQPVDMRGRTAPPQPRHSCGNLVITAVSRRVAAAEAEADGIGMAEMAEVIGGGIREGIDGHRGIFCGERDGRDVVSENVGRMIGVVMDEEKNVVVFTDWSKFGFYEANFGWGKPVWVGTGRQRPRRNTVVVMSDREGDGIEAWVHLGKDEMRCFKEDEEIKLFTETK